MDRPPQLWYNTFIHLLLQSLFWSLDCLISVRLLCLSLATISMIDGSASPYFQSEGVFRSKGNSLWVSCKQNIDGSCFFFPHSATLCLLIGASMPLTFRVSTQRYEIIAIMCLVPLDFVVVFFVLHSLWYYWCFFIVFFFFFHLFSPQRVPLKIPWGLV